MFRVALLSRWHVHSHKPDQRYVKDLLKQPDCAVTCVWDTDVQVAREWAEEYGVPYEVHVYSAHRTPIEAKEFSENARKNGFGAIIAAAGMAAALPGVIAAMTPLPVIGLPINSTLDGVDALLSIVQMPPGISVATVGINNGMNAAVMAVQILALGDEALAKRFAEYRATLSEKIVKANDELKNVKYNFKVD